MLWYLVGSSWIIVWKISQCQEKPLGTSCQLAKLNQFLSIQANMCYIFPKRWQNLHSNTHIFLIQSNLLNIPAVRLTLLIFDFLPEICSYKKMNGKGILLSAESHIIWKSISYEVFNNEWQTWQVGIALWVVI